MIKLLNMMLYDTLIEVDVCSLTKVIGRCRAMIPKFWYNKETGKCERFNYGGCGANMNNFDTAQDCQNKCGKPQKPEDPCEVMKCILYILIIFVYQCHICNTCYAKYRN